MMEKKTVGAKPDRKNGMTAKWLLLSSQSRVEVWSKNNVRLAVISGEKKLFSPQSARIF